MPSVKYIPIMHQISHQPTTQHGLDGRSVTLQFALWSAVAMLNAWFFGAVFLHVVGIDLAPEDSVCPDPNFNPLPRACHWYRRTLPNGHDPYVIPVDKGPNISLGWTMQIIGGRRAIVRRSEFHTIGSPCFLTHMATLSPDLRRDPANVIREWSVQLDTILTPWLYRGYYLMRLISITTRCMQRRSRIGLCGLCVCIFIHFNLLDRLRKIWDPSDQDPHSAHRPNPTHT